MEGYDDPTVYKPHLIVVYQKSDGAWEAHLEANEGIWAESQGKSQSVLSLLVTLKSFGYSARLEDYVVREFSRRPTSRTKT